MSESLFTQDGYQGGGFRLRALDVFNWGTFDSTSGIIHPMELDGSTALLVGMNGSGKSTLVDAVLTLLVRPGIRNYNLASGAAKRERNEKSYMKGAYGRFSNTDESYAKTQYLRNDGNHYTVLLGAFENQVTGQGFTLLQVLYMGGESKVKKIFGFFKQSTRLNDLLNGQKTPSELKQSLKSKGFNITDSYKVYHGYFAKMTGMRPKAMDMFNQTVSVKDIPSLNVFIRKHMLEKINWEDTLNAMFGHFADLNKAHNSLLVVRKQAEMLLPLVKAGRRFQQHRSKLEKTQAIQAASESYFHEKTIELLTPCLDEYIANKNGLDDEIENNQNELDDINEKQRQIKNEIDQAGGNRLREIPLLIKNEELEAKGKRKNYGDYHRLLKNAGVERDVKSQDDFQNIRKESTTQIQKIAIETNILSKSGDEFIIERGQLIRLQEEEQSELKALGTRRTNLPENLVFLRSNLCNDLKIKENQLFFAAELISVNPEQIAWLPSIEKVLRSFGMNLLVRDEYYHIVSQYLDRIRLKDRRGKGQRLAYLRVYSSDGRYPQNDGVSESQMMISKLQFKQNHPMSVWVENEIRKRFNFQCCQNIRGFQIANGLAMTKNCQFKRPGGRHEKDDRDAITDPRRFILGWDNQEKRRRLRDSIKDREDKISEYDRLIERYEKNKIALNNKKQAWQEIACCQKFSEINYWPHEQEVASLQREKLQIENSNDTISFLRTQLEKLVSKQKAIGSLREEQIGQLSLLKQQIKQAENEVQQSENSLSEREAKGFLSQDREMFLELDDFFVQEPLVAENLRDRKIVFDKQQREHERQLQQQLEPLQDKLTKHMGRFLREFNTFGDRLAATPDYFTDFEDLQRNIIEEGLPEHEKRFKERLNEKVTQEIALFNTNLNQQQEAIRSKMELLNKSLKTLDYNPGSFMILEAKAINDPEIQAFRQGLRDCIEGQFKDSADDNEARYVRIAKLIKRLEDEKRWRDKVIDVRRWFQFMARELDRETHAELNAYEDASGQSGGEKAKLAFTILVAAVAYQYDIDPYDHQCDRFRFIVVDEMFSKVDDRYATYALQLFRQFGLQLLIVAPLDPKARITENFVQKYFHVVKKEGSHSNIFTMTAERFEEIAND